MKRFKIVQKILEGKNKTVQKQEVEVFAPINIALVKYWGKRDQELNLPTAGSLSLTFPEWGTKTKLSLLKGSPSLKLQGREISWETPFGKRLRGFLSLFSLQDSLSVSTESNIPIASGLASSASGFAALVKALNLLCDWNADLQTLSCLARLGSGSACRSLWQGFVLWNRGTQEDGFDSHGTPLPFLMPDLVAGIIVLQESPKEISSREAMEITQKTSPGYSQWVDHTEKDLVSILKILQEEDFKALGDLTEKNALALHNVMGSAIPSISYTNQETLATIERIYALRAQGLSVYWTQDAGPNLKLLFLKKDEHMVRKAFPNLWVSYPFSAFVS